MSGEAFGWARSPKTWCSGGMPAKAVLMLMADYAGTDSELWPSVATMAAELQTTERTIQRMIATLETDGYVVREVRKTRTGRSTSNLYRVNVGAPDPRLLVTHTPDHSSPSPPTNSHPHPDQWSPSTTLEPPLEPTFSDENAAGARAQAVEQEFEVVAALWIAAAPARFARVPAWAAWEVVCEHHDPADLVRAARRYLVEGVKVDGGRVKALAKWLSDGWFEGFLGETPDGSVAAVVTNGVFADAAIRKTVVTLKDEDFARSYLDRSSWDDVGRTITAWSTSAAAKLRTLNNNPVWPKLAITVRDPEPVNLGSATA